MNRHYFLILSLFFSIHLNAQTGIGTTTPNASAKLDVYSTNKGFLPPRVTLTSATDASTIASPAEGLLVYNLGSVGLQAGYYYWNGTSWATIATASSAGNGVTSSDMVKLYSKAYSAATADSTIANATGYKFTVPVSGRYLFDFSSTAYLNQSSLEFYFRVRQGTTILGSDIQISNNNNVHVEYSGKVEVNLQAGVTYNVSDSVKGSRDGGDYDRVYYKMVSGNLPVTGQSVDYVSVGSISTTGVGGSQDLIFPTNYGGNIPYNTSTGVFTLSANKTYLFQAQVRVNNPSAGGNYIEYGFVDAVSNALLVNGTQTITSSSTSTAGYGSNPVINFIYTPNSNQTVKIRTTSNTVGTQTVTSGTANITQIGSSAIVNPWTLSGTNTYNTTGNVGIGTTSPSTTLTVGNTAGTIGGEILLNPTSTQYEGGQIVFKRSLVGSTVDWTLDQYGTSSSNARFRIFNGSSETNGIAILENGYLGIGTATPSNKLHVQSSDGTTVYIESTTADNNGMMVLNANTNQNWSSNWHEFIYFRNQGSTIGSIIGSNGGNMVSYNTSSDYRLKTDFKGYNGLDLVNKIKTYDYAWKRDSSRMYGFVAHELQEVIPYLVSGTKDAVDANGKIIPQSVDYSKLTPILVKAIQEQDVKIKKQEGDIKKLSDDNLALEQRIIHLEKIIKKYINHN